MNEDELKALQLKEEQEKAAMLETIKSEVTKIVSDSLKNHITQKEADEKLEKMNKDISKLNLNLDETKTLKESIDEIIENQNKTKESIETIGLAVKTLQERGTSNSRKTIGLGDLFKNALIENGLTEKNEDLSKYGGDVIRLKINNASNKSLAKIETKSAIDMTTALMLLPGSDPGTNVGYLTDYSMRNVLLNASKDMSLLDILPVTPISDKYFGVVVEYTEFDGTATTGEDASAGKSSFLLKTIQFQVFKINTYYHIPEENLEDIDGLAAKINRIGKNAMTKQINEQILNTTGDGSTAIKGMLVSGNYTAFASATYAATVELANIVNLIGKMKLQAELTDDNVNVVGLNPTQVDEIEQQKDALGNSLLDRSVKFDAVGNLMSIKGLLVFKSKKITANTCIVFSNEAAEVGLRRDFEAIIGLDSDDLTTGMRTIVLSVRLAMGVGKPSAIIYSSNITNDVTTITYTGA